MFPGALEPLPEPGPPHPLSLQGREGAFTGKRPRLGGGRVAADRAPAPLRQGLYEKALEDSEKALSLDSENIRALFRKARTLNELGRHKEAYECSSRCSLALPHVSVALHPHRGRRRARRQPSVPALTPARPPHLSEPQCPLFHGAADPFVSTELCVPGVAKDTLH